MKHFILVTVLITLIYTPKTGAQNSNNDCEGKYNCWVAKAHNTLKLEKFIDAAYQFAAAQACDDAPIPDTLEYWIAKTYQANIQFIEQQKKEANALVKNAENQDVANNITGDFAQIMKNEDLTLQALLLHLACKKTQNTNKLAMRARREILSNPENRFYKRAETVNTEGVKTVISKDGSLIAQIKPTQLTLNKPYKFVNVVLPPIIQAHFSPNNKYLFIETQDKGNMRGETYIASKSVTQKHSFCIYKTDEMTLVQALETTEPIAAAAFSQSSDSLIFVHSDGKITIQDIKNRINSSNGQIKLEKTDVIDNLLMTNTEQRLLVSFSDGRIALYKNNGKQLQKFPPFHSQSIKTWDITEDDKMLITGSSDSSMTLWSLKNKAIWFGHKKFNHVVTSVAFSPDGKYNITSSLDKSITIKDKEGSVVLNAKGHNQGVLASGFSAFGNTFYSMDADKMKTWDFKVDNFDVEDYVVPIEENDEDEENQNIVFSDDKMYSVRQNTEGSLLVLDAQKKELYRFDSTTVYDFSPDNSFFIIAQHDSVFAWSLKKKELLWAIKSKMNVDLAYFSFKDYQNYFMLENLNEEKCELWNIPNNQTAPQLIFKDNISSPEFFADGALFYFFNKDFKTEIRKTSEPRTVVAILNESSVKLFYSRKNAPLYALYLSDIELENKAIAKKYTLFEINIQDVEKNKKMQPALYFDMPLDVNMVFDFSETGDSILFFKDKKIYSYTNSIKLLNEGKYLPKVLDNKIKRKSGIMTNDDCLGIGQLDDMMECSLFFAENACLNPDAMSKFEELMKEMNFSKINKRKMDTTEASVWQKFTEKLANIVAAYPYETNFKEKIKIAKQIIEIRENVILDTKSKELGTQYGALCWYNLFDDKADRFKKAVFYGEKALKMIDEDWVQANLGHAYLLNNDFEKAQEKYAFFAERLEELFKDFDILEKSDITHPRMKEMKEGLLKLKN
jgi:WD40 repeat protein